MALYEHVLLARGAGDGPASLIIGIECLVGGEGLLLEVGLR